MTDKRPRNLAIFQLIDTDLARKCTVRLVKDVLRRDFDTLAEVLAAEEEVERRWSNHNLCGSRSVGRAPLLGRGVDGAGRVG